MFHDDAPVEQVILLINHFCRLVQLDFHDNIYQFKAIVEVELVDNRDRFVIVDGLQKAKGVVPVKNMIMSMEVT